MPGLVHHPAAAFSIMGWEPLGAAASHHSQALVPKQQSDAPTPHMAREGAAHVGDNKLHESPDLGTAWEEKAQGLISLGIQSL